MVGIEHFRNKFFSLGWLSPRIPSPEDFSMVVSFHIEEKRICLFLLRVAIPSLSADKRSQILLCFLLLLFLSSVPPVISLLFVEPYFLQI